jgi:SAM-dependent methyltransferase
MHYQIDFACRDSSPQQEMLNELYAYGDDVGTKVLHRCRLNLFTLIMRRLRERGQITRLDRAIDIGCNAGVYSSMLSEFGFRSVLGVDVVPSMIETARRHFAVSQPQRSVEFRLQRAEELASEGTFDFLLCTEVIEHTDEPRETIENIRRMIGPGGVAVISMPNRISYPYLKAWAAYRLQRRSRDLDFERHLEYPFPRAMGLFTGGDRSLIHVDGTNLFWEDKSIRAWYARGSFPALNRWNFQLARLWPLKFFAQFFYVVVKRAESGPRS